MFDAIKLLFGVKNTWENPTRLNGEITRVEKMKSVREK
jgi:hypothetical protein